MGIRIKRLTNRDREFYPTLGPFLARRHIEKEMGGRIYDDDQRVWYVAIDGREVVGFCSAMATTSGAEWKSAYVTPTRRRRGVYRELWETRADEWPGPVKAVCTAASLPMFEKHGFRRVRDRGRFVEVRRD